MVNIPSSTRSDEKPVDFWVPLDYIRYIVYDEYTYRVNFKESSKLADRYFPEMTLEIIAAISDKPTHNSVNL